MKLQVYMLFMGSWFDSVRDYRPSVFTQLLLVFAFIAILLLIGAQRYPSTISEELAVYLVILMFFISVLIGIVQGVFAVFNVYDRYALESLKYFKSVAAGISGGLIVYVSSSFEMESLSSTGAILGEVLSLMITSLLIIFVLLVGLIGFIVIEYEHRQKIRENQNNNIETGM